MTRSIDYRSPSTPSGGRLADHLRRRMRLDLAMSFALIACAAPLVLFGPAMMALFISLSTFFWWGIFPYVRFFWGFTLILIPAMFLGEAKVRGGFSAGGILEEKIGGEDGPMLNPWLGDLNLFINPRLEVSGLVESILLGPRLMMDGLTKLRRCSQLKNVNFARAAEIINQLAEHDKAVGTSALLRSGETIADLVPALSLLILQDWIEVALKDNRVWLISYRREKLEELGVAFGIKPGL